ncbi:hypothetical protein [Bordetella sp. N]|uniref:hypothetical protein n=1 Tax=Bordetella sp. N TaxID=1746199 RepID=UPI00070E0E8A|nr:hypothetical protein [Bordetella sp. N]ALM86565.1 hypothetical protein ASB57_29775 [Bordetella sp. N]
MEYENLYWGMATIVGLAVIGGGLFALFRGVINSLGACVILATLNACGVLHFAGQGPVADQATLLALASFMFTLVIAVAASLVMRRVLRRT